jgi:hypothetical protein
MYNGGGYIYEASIALLSIVFVSLIVRNADIDGFRAEAKPLGKGVYIVLLAATAALLAYSVLRVFGTLSPTVLLDNYPKYYALSRDGGAIIFFAAYAILYVILIDMYFSGVTPFNFAVFIAAIMINSVNGGRGLLIIMVICAVLLTIQQAKRISGPILLAVAAAFLMLSLGYFLTGLRSNWKIDDAEADRLNFNSAFIIEDTLKALDENRIEHRLIFLEDLKYLFVPRSLNPEKPRSTAETRALYPEVAARGTGTNITFPLKANLLVNLGPNAAYADWAVVLLFSVLFLHGVRVRNRAPSFLGFFFFFWGCAFVLIARGGILNARLITQSVVIFAGFALYWAMAPRRSVRAGLTSRSSRPA